MRYYQYALLISPFLITKRFGRGKLDPFYSTLKPQEWYSMSLHDLNKFGSSCKNFRFTSLNMALSIMKLYASLSKMMTASSLMWRTLQPLPLICCHFPFWCLHTTSKPTGKTHKSAWITVREEEIHIENIKTAEHGHNVLCCDGLNSDFDKFGLKSQLEDEPPAYTTGKVSKIIVNQVSRVGECCLRACNNTLHNTFGKVLQGAW